MAAVVYLHGLWMPGEESLLLRRRLREEFALELHPFRYAPSFSDLPGAIERLRAFIAGLAPAELHLVGHSLGGLVIYRFLERYPAQPPGRVVFLGTPANGSRAAQVATRFAPVAHFMGESVMQELLAPAPRHWGHARELGIIAGTEPLGVGQLLAQFTEANDGTVAVSETRLTGATDHLTLPVSHMGMLFSPRVAHATGAFLAHGRFPLA
ncbi:MAG: alpha/beta hydrolase [Gammaproteobacteria bacterium]|nr:alpha/beta hydrolase [Gammaproteobacteria bacterium]MBV9621077.1 alpha/beta hydrolase [Gammaproteobacteria bacterium]